MRSVVVVGASLAGFHGAQALRKAGFDGEVTLIGAEPHRAYDRPPLSKEFLSGRRDEDVLRLAGVEDDSADGLGLTWRLAAARPGLDLTARKVELSDGTSLAFEGLLVATGGSPRQLP